MTEDADGDSTFMESRLKTLFALSLCLFSISASADWASHETPASAYAVWVGGNEAKTIYEALNVQPQMEDGQAIKRFKTSSGLFGVACSQKNRRFFASECVITYENRSQTKSTQISETVLETSSGTQPGGFPAQFRQVEARLTEQEAEEICTALKTKAIRSGNKGQSDMVVFESSRSIHKRRLSVGCHIVNGGPINLAVSFLSASEVGAFSKHVERAPDRRSPVSTAQSELLDAGVYATY